MKQVTSADGTTIAYETHGEGRPVICLHGTGVTRRVWTPLVSHLDGVRLLIPDRRGRGDSGDTSPWSFEREREDVVAIAETVTEPPVLLGSSYGGLLALRTAEQVSAAALVLYEPPMPREVVGTDEEYESLADRVESLLRDGERAAAVRLFFEEATGAETIEAWPIWPECVALAETIAREAAFVESFELGDPEITSPTLLLRGEYSESYLRAGIDILAERLPETQTVEIPAGHAGVATAPREVAAAIRGLLTR